MMAGKTVPQNKGDLAQMNIGTSSGSSASAQNSATIREEEQQLNVWIPKLLMKRLKIKAAETDRSLKDMVTEALTKYL